MFIKCRLILVVTVISTARAGAIISFRIELVEQVFNTVTSGFSIRTLESKSFFFTCNTLSHNLQEPLFQHWQRNHRIIHTQHPGCSSRKIALCECQFHQCSNRNANSFFDTSVATSVDPTQLSFPAVPVPPLFFIMDAVSRNLDQENMESDDREGAVADLKTQLGEMQIGGGGDMLMDDYDVVDEKQNVAIITPDDSVEDTDPLATDCTFTISSWESQIP